MRNRINNNRKYAKLVYNLISNSPILDYHLLLKLMYTN